MNTKTKWLIGGGSIAALVLASGLTFAAARDHGHGGGQAGGSGRYGMHQSDGDRGDRGANSERRSEGRFNDGRGRDHHGMREGGQDRGQGRGERQGMNHDRDEGGQGMGRHMDGERHRDNRSGFGYGRNNDNGPGFRTEQKAAPSQTEQPNATQGTEQH